MERNGSTVAIRFYAGEKLLRTCEVEVEAGDLEWIAEGSELCFSGDGHLF